MLNIRDTNKQMTFQQESTQLPGRPRGFGATANKPLVLVSIVSKRGAATEVFS